MAHPLRGSVHHIIDRVYCMGHEGGNGLCNKIDMDTVKVGVVLTYIGGLVSKTSALTLNLSWIAEGSKPLSKEITSENT